MKSLDMEEFIDSERGEGSDAMAQMLQCLPGEKINMILVLKMSFPNYVDANPC